MASPDHYPPVEVTRPSTNPVGVPAWFRLIGYGLLVLLAFGTSARADNLSLELQALDGEHVNLNQYIGNGKWVLVMLWATDCVICMREKPAISAFHDRHKHKDALVLGVALDGYDKIEDIRQYLADHKPTFPTLVGNISLISFNYQALTGERLRGTPTYLLFSPSGELLGNNPGPVRPVAIEAFIARHQS